MPCLTLCSLHAIRHRLVTGINTVFNGETLFSIKMEICQSLYALVEPHYKLQFPPQLCLIKIIYMQSKMI